MALLMCTPAACGGAQASNPEGDAGADVTVESSTQDDAAPDVAKGHDGSVDAHVLDAHVTDAAKEASAGCNGPSDCPIGESCMDGACSTFCDPSHSCHGGCCDGVCLPGNATSACGATGGACMTCVDGAQSCSGEMCVNLPCNSGAPCGVGFCCDSSASAGGACVPVSDASCAAGGQACQDCTASGTICLGNGTCGHCATPADCPLGTTCLAGGACTAVGCDTAHLCNGSSYCCSAEYFGTCTETVGGCGSGKCSTGICFCAANADCPGGSCDMQYDRCY